MCLTFHCTNTSSDKPFAASICGLCKCSLIFYHTYTSRMRSPIIIPATSAGPPSKTALIICNGGYNTPFIDFNWPPSDTCPLTLNPNPLSPFFSTTLRGSYGLSCALPFCFSSIDSRSLSPSAILKKAPFADTGGLGSSLCLRRGQGDWLSKAVLAGLC